MPRNLFILVFRCKNWKIISQLCKTNLPANTATRSPGNILILGGLGDKPHGVSNYGLLSGKS